MTATVARVAVKPPHAQWLAPTGLILLALIPIVAGGMRITELTGNPLPTPANARFLDSPVPVIAHIVSVTVFSLLGALQFVPALRRRGARWHRIVGGILIPAGMVTALSGMWMAAFYSHPAGDGAALLILRLVFGAAMVGALILAVRALARRQFAAHGAWMTRAYAIGIGAGTQAIVLIPGSIIFGSTHEPSRAALMGAAWIINLAVAELVIRRRAQRHFSNRQAMRGHQK